MLWNESYRERNNRWYKRWIKRAGIDEVVLTGSTEENFPSFSTGLGITVLGIVDNSVIKVNNVNNFNGNNENIIRMIFC